MPNLGPAELLVILAIALLVFGPKKLPEFGKSVGKALREFNNAKNDFMSSIHTDDDYDDRPRRSTPDDTVSASESHELDYPAPPDLDSADAMPYGSDFHSASTDGDTQLALHGAVSESGTPATLAAEERVGNHA